MNIATLRFTLADQQAFARLSGDFNPIHVDPIAARRGPAGEPIVHGMNLLLGALDVHFARRAAARQVTVAAKFRHPALLGDSIRLISTGRRRLTLTVDGAAPLVEIEIDSRRGDRSSPPRGPFEVTLQRRHRPGRQSRARTLDEIEHAGGTLRLSNSRAMRRAFPHIARMLSDDAVAAMLAVSRLVGMECPGLRSLLSAVHFDIAARSPSTQLRWRVAGVDRRFGRVRLDIDAGCVRGSVDAFLLPPAATPRSIEAVAAVGRNEFSGQRAVIVGGSRGLGAATAMLVAAGGGVPLITYASGAAEARALARDIRRAGGQAETLRFDVLGKSFEPLARAARRLQATHLYYFATPKIFGRRRGPFDDRLFRRFAEFYATGFANACAAVANGGPLHAFFPSSTALDERRRELIEYIAAKAAGESLAAALPAAAPGLAVMVRRLPRIATDQTVSIVSVHALDPAAAMLPIVRELHGSIAAPR